jgi:hypothetical protein
LICRANKTKTARAVNELLRLTKNLDYAITFLSLRVVDGSVAAAAIVSEILGGRATLSALPDVSD